MSGNTSGLAMLEAIRLHPFVTLLFGLCVIGIVYILLKSYAPEEIRI